MVPSSAATTPAAIKRTYYVLLLGNTLATSLIWGINTIFLLDAGLSNLEAFAANAFFTAGMVLFEVPTGIVADMWGRRTSFLLGTLTLAVTTALYVLLWQVDAPFWQWAVVSLLLGLGYTFFSGATEAWLVDALTTSGYEGPLDPVFARGEVLSGVGMLLGAVGGGYIAQLTNLGVPFVLRALVLGVMFVVALILMHDIGFTPRREGNAWSEVKNITGNSVEYGWRVPAVKYLMIAGIFTGGVAVYVFYALQPHLLDLWGDSEAYGIAGLAAAIIAGSQILGGLLSGRIRTLFRRRTSAILLAEIVGVVAILLIGLVSNFWAVIGLIVVWGLLGSAAIPIRQAYLNGLIPSQQRATILSFDSLMASSGGVVAQPVLGRVADMWGYPASYLLSGVINAFAVPFLFWSRRQNAPADVAADAPAPAETLAEGLATPPDATADDITQKGSRSPGD
jgi:MFS family permease